MAAVGPGYEAPYFPRMPPLTLLRARASVSGTARANTRRSSTRSVTSGFAAASRYQRPLPPRTERTKAAPSTTTAQITVSRPEEEALRRVPIWTSSVRSSAASTSRSNRVPAAPSSGLPIPLLVDDLVERLAGRAAAPATGRFIRVAQGDGGPQGPPLRDAEEPLGLGPAAPHKPPDARTDAMGVGRGHDPLAQPPLVVGLLLFPLPGHHGHYAQRGPGQVARVALDPGEGLERLLVPDHDQFPGLLVGGAAREAGDLEHVVNDLLRHGIPAELTQRPEREQEAGAVTGDGLIGHAATLPHPGQHLPGLGRVRRDVVDGGGRFLPPALGERAHVHRGEAYLLDQTRDDPLRLLVVPGDEDDLPLLDRGLGKAVVPQPRKVNGVEGLDDAGAGQVPGDELARGPAAEIQLPIARRGVVGGGYKKPSPPPLPPPG